MTHIFNSCLRSIEDTEKWLLKECKLLSMMKEPMRNKSKRSKRKI